MSVTGLNLEGFLQSGDSRSLELWRYVQSGSNLAKFSIWPLQDKFSPSQSGDIINLASLAIKRQSGANVRRPSPGRKFAGAKKNNLSRGQSIPDAGCLACLSAGASQYRPGRRGRPGLARPAESPFFF